MIAKGERGRIIQGSAKIASKRRQEKVKGKSEEAEASF
jgi:hypothetical protein